MMRNIFLLGMPSSGKSTLGKSLARELNLEFVDMDKRIEIRELMTVHEIFTLRGEPYFREIEREILHSLPVNAGLIVSTGGGVPCFFDNMAYIKENGISIFLDVPPRLLADRILHTRKNDRPHYSIDQHPDQIVASLEGKLSERRAIYQQADVTIEGETDIQTLMEVLRHLGVNV
ncbi:MAG: shikimate kinase [Siphonobacter sp.]